jgi:membrane-associated protease RseP (regulator of RpoE activity)
MIELPGVLAFAILLLLQPLAVGLGKGMGACLLLCAGGVLTFLALLAIHELGHLLAGRAVGLRFSRFTVGLFRVAREGDHIRVRLNTAWFQPAAYVVQRFPGGPIPRLRWAVAVLGGPLSNLLVGVACLVAANRLHPGPPVAVAHSAQAGWRGVALLMPGNLATAQLNLAGVLSLGIGLATLVPGQSAGLRTDGGQLWDLWRKKDRPASRSS